MLLVRPERNDQNDKRRVTVMNRVVSSQDRGRYRLSQSMTGRTISDRSVDTSMG